MSKHTPGPWKVFEWGGVIDPYPGIEGNGISIVIYGNEKNGFGVQGRNYEEALANARLIAAAPDLLEALKEVLETIKSSEHWWIDCPSRGGFDACKIEAAIARAGVTEGGKE